MRQNFYTSLTAIACYFILDSFFLPWLYPGVLAPFMSPEIPVIGYRLPQMGIKVSGDNDFLINIIFLYPVSALLVLVLGDSFSKSILKLCHLTQLLPLALSVVIIVRTFTLFGSSSIQNIGDAIGIGLYQTIIASLVLAIIGIRGLVNKG